MGSYLMHLWDVRPVHLIIIRKKGPGREVDARIISEGDEAYGENGREKYGWGMRQQRSSGPGPSPKAH